MDLFDDATGRKKMCGGAVYDPGEGGGLVRGIEVGVDMFERRGGGERGGV